MPPIQIPPKPRDDPPPFVRWPEELPLGDPGSRQVKQDKKKPAAPVVYC